MKILEIVRLEESDNGTFGILKINKEVFCYTLEPADRENKQSVSSIPTGQYVVKPYTSGRWGETWEITGVTDRTYILFHPGNLVSHTEGCVLLGDTVKKLNGGKLAMNSGTTFKKFKQVLDGEEEVHLTISEVY